MYIEPDEPDNSDRIEALSGYNPIRSEFISGQKILIRIRFFGSDRITDLTRSVRSPNRGSMAAEIDVVRSMRFQYPSSFSLTFLHKSCCKKLGFLRHSSKCSMVPIITRRARAMVG